MQFEESRVQFTEWHIFDINEGYLKTTPLRIGYWYPYYTKYRNVISSHWADPNQIEHSGLNTLGTLLERHHYGLHRRLQFRSCLASVLRETCQYEPT